MSCFVKIGNITHDNCTYEKYMYNSTQTEIYNMYRNSYTQFLELSRIRNDLQRSSYTDQLQSFFTNTVVISCIWYAVFVTENLSSYKPMYCSREYQASTRESEMIYKDHHIQINYNLFLPTLLWSLVYDMQFL